VTFLLSDIESSTRLWEQAPEAMPRAVADSYAILDEAVAAHRGVRPEEQGEGDSVVAAFARASDALAAALQAQRALRAHAWPDGLELRVRIALYTADAQLRDEGNYFGVALARCARLRAIAHGGQTLLSRATHDLVVDRLPTGAKLVDCGVHRLRDLGRPEHVYTLAHPELLSAPGPLRSLDARPNNLPGQLTSFVGRARELDEARGAIGETRLLTLTGAGGVGKTRLALQVAADALDGFGDGVWWVQLAALADPELVGEALAAALGVRPLPKQTALQACCTYLGRRRALIVLDNCEHLLAACAGAAEALLRACPDVTVIATSRTPLGVAGETDWRVPSLSLPGRDRGREPIDALAQSDAVRLFTERASKVRPRFAVTNDNAPAVAQVCRELDGLPLAIELAAARVRMLSLEQIAAGLGDRFRLLTGGTHSALPRQQTLRASMDWSHELLSEQERVLFRRLSVFAGGFTLDACEQVGAGDGLERTAILDLLASLVDKSLIVAEDHGPAMRYRLLETVRHYAAERLAEAGETETTRARHVDAFLALAESGAKELEGAGQRTWLGGFDADAANLATALDCAADADGERARRLCAALTLWWRQRGLYTAAEQGFGRALESGDAAPSALRARVLWGRAHVLFFAGSYEVAVTVAQSALTMAQEVGDQRAVCRALADIGAIRFQPDPIGARPGLARACEVARACGDQWCLIYALMYLAVSYVVSDEYDEAERRLGEMLLLGERHGLRNVVALTLWGMSTACLMRADLPRSAELAERSLAAAQEIGDPVVTGFAQAQLAQLDLVQGQAAAAVARLEASRERAVAAGSGLLLPYTETFLAAARAVTGDLDAACTALDWVIASRADQGRALAFAMLDLADLLRVAGDCPGAETRARQAREIGDRLGNPLVVAWSADVLGRLAIARGEYGEAEVLLHEALARRVEHRLRLHLPQTLDALAEVAAGLDSHEEAARILGAAQRARADLGLVRWAPDEPRLAQLEHALRAELGDDAFHAGAELSLEEAVAWLRRARGERKRPQRGWESLTPTELQVAQLVAAGLTNPQIGERMFISRGTVKVHLSHIFGKLGIATRAELAAEATRRSADATS
jgi:predicted ATPase/class 3 adenylate cyclase/DNA-binding CsgD family transcriptional regulator